MAVYNMMLCMVIIFMVQLYAIGQQGKSVIQCDNKPYDYTANCESYKPVTEIRCEPHHVILIINVTLGYYNETEKQTCCQRMPDNICTVDVNYDRGLLGFFYFLVIDPSVLSQLTYIELDSFYSSQRQDNCSSQSLISYIEYMCVSDASIINMTQPGISHNLRSFSLAKNNESYPRFDGHFNCSCDITADDADVYIDTTVLYLRFSSGYDNNLKINSQNLTVRYDQNHTNMNFWGILKEKYLFYKQLKQTKGPIHLVYENYKRFSDKIWIGFRATEGRLKVSCTGCQSTSSDKIKSTEPGLQAPAWWFSRSGYALIIGLVTIGVIGLVMIGVAIYKTVYSRPLQPNKHHCNPLRGSAYRSLLPP